MKSMKPPVDLPINIETSIGNIWMTIRVAPIQIDKGKVVAAELLSPSALIKCENAFTSKDIVRPMVQFLN